MLSPSEQVVLSEIDVELTLLGSLFSAPEAFNAIANDISGSWFSDPFARYLYEAAMRLHDGGNILSPPAIVASLPEDCGGTPRGHFYARAIAAALPVSSIGGLVSTLKDRWARRSLIDTAEQMKLAAVRFDADPYDVTSDAVVALDTINASRAVRAGGSLEDATKRLIASLDDAAALRGPSTGILALNNKLNGYRAGQLYVIAGRPGMGKSAFMCSSLRRTAESGHGVAIFSLEMTAEEIAARCMSDALDRVQAPMFGSILKGALSPKDKADLQMASDSLAGIPLHVDASPRLTFSEVAGRARKVKARLEAGGQRLAVLCIDHMGLVQPSERYRGNKVAEAGEISGAARALAKELDCCVVLLCQLSRDVEKRDDKRPVMSDLRWSGEIEQDAHVVGFLYRPAYYLEQDQNADPYAVADARFKLDFLIRKNRNGPTGDVRLWCSIAHSSVRDDIS